MNESDIAITTSVEQTHWWYRERRAIIAREIAGMTPGKAIEIGAAGGGNSMTLIEHGWDVVATEYLEAGVEVARSRGLNAIQADARKLPLEDETFDLAVAFDVLEHIEEDHLAAAELFRVLRPGATALIAVPCDMALWSEFDVLSGHVRRYTRETLTALISGAGFEIQSLWSWNVLLRPLLKLRRSNGASEKDVSEVPPVVNFGLSTIIKSERYLPVKSLPGVSLMLRARRP